MYDGNNPHMQRKFASKLFKIVKKLLIALSASQCFSALSLLALGIAGISLGAAYAYVGMAIWVGFCGCTMAAMWAAISSQPTERSHGMVAIIVVESALVAFFILSFFSASVDFNNILSSLNAISSTSIDCNSLIMVNQNVLLGRLLVDMLEIIITLIPMISNIGIMYYGCRIFGKQGFLNNMPRNSAIAADANQSSGNNPQAVLPGNTNKVDVESASNTANPETRRKAANRMLMTQFWPVMSTILVLSLVAAAADIIGLVLRVADGMPPPVWNIVAFILACVGQSLLDKGNKNWHIVLLVSFSLSFVGNIAVIIIGIVKLQQGWNEISYMYQVTNALSVCAGSSVASSSNASVSTPSNNVTKVWMLVIEIVHIMLNFYLALLTIGEVTVVTVFVKFINKHVGTATEPQQQSQPVTNAGASATPTQTQTQTKPPTASA